ncbi:helix-turn-helix domain-containing protein [Rhodococcus xishaensis]|uniref:helix-turn-helix domain-containing protein n=1 Tax=Rhodococcus xishaensis TaxID=2487364 RepID=UPI0013E29448|nr:helix-turn-helix transcriptional regulator [Rhodococcus xishaensis]
MRQIVGAELRAARARVGISQKELASRTSMSHATIMRFENAERSIDILQLLKICSALGADAGQILDLAQQQVQEL